MMSYLIIQINDVKGVKFRIIDICENGEKENLGKDRYKRECGEGNEGVEQEDTAKDSKVEEVEAGKQDEKNI